MPSFQRLRLSAHAVSISLAITLVLSLAAPQAVVAQERKRILQPRSDTMRIAPRNLPQVQRPSSRITSTPRVVPTQPQKPRRIQTGPRTPTARYPGLPAPPSQLPSVVPETPRAPVPVQPGQVTRTGAATYGRQAIQQQRRTGAFQYLCRTDRKQCWVNTQTQFPLNSRCRCGDFSGVTILER